jgi:hypothetical protein
VYPEATGPQASFLASDLLSVEWSSVQANLPKMAVIMGEFGTYEGTFKDVVVAGALDCFFHVFSCVFKPFSCSAVRSMEIQVRAVAAAGLLIRLLAASCHFFACRCAAAATASAAGCIGHGTARNAQACHQLRLNCTPLCNVTPLFRTVLECYGSEWCH